MMLLATSLTDEHTQGQSYASNCFYTQPVFSHFNVFVYIDTPNLICNYATFTGGSHTCTCFFTLITWHLHTHEYVRI